MVTLLDLQARLLLAVEEGDADVGCHRDTLTPQHPNTLSPLTMYPHTGASCGFAVRAAGKSAGRSRSAAATRPGR
jgi:hypothetical protein